MPLDRNVSQRAVRDGLLRYELALVGGGSGDQSIGDGHPFAFDADTS
jgi:hypothetical protein